MLEYIWLDGYADQNVRSKTKVVSIKDGETLGAFPDWSFDGSSTNQADGSENTDCVLKPVFSCPDPFRGGPHRLVFCEVYEADGETPHPTNSRNILKKFIGDRFIGKVFDDVPWFGWEQEYTFTKKKTSKELSVINRL